MTANSVEMNLVKLGEEKQRILNKIIDLNLQLKKTPDSSGVKSQLAAAETKLKTIRATIDTAQKEKMQRVR